RLRVVAVSHGVVAASEELVRLEIRRRTGRGGRRDVQRERLLAVGGDDASEGAVVSGALGRNVLALEAETALGGEQVAGERVGRPIFAVVARDRHRQRRPTL